MSGVWWWTVLAVSIAWLVGSGIFMYIQQSIESDSSAQTMLRTSQNRWIPVDIVAFAVIIVALSQLGL